MRPLMMVLAEGFKDWSVWAPIIVLSQVMGLIVYEVIALHRPDDSWPTITAMTIFAMKKHWWVAPVIFGTLGWLIVHFAKRLFGWN